MDISTYLLSKISICLLLGVVVWGPIVFSIRSKSISASTQTDEPDFILHQPRSIFWIGILGTTLFFTFVVLTVLDGDGWSALFFSLFALLGTFLSVYSLKWKIVVHQHQFTISMPFHHTRVVALEEISSVKQNYHGLFGYIDGKRIFAVDNFVINFNLFFTQLYEAGKMESTQKKNRFIVMEHRGNLIIAVCGLLFLGACLLWAIFWPNDSVNGFVYLALTGFTALNLYLLMHTLRWRLSVTEDRMTVRKMIGREKTFSVQEITKVIINSDHILIFVKEKKAAKVGVGYRNFPILMERLANQNIPFYEKRR